MVGATNIIANDLRRMAPDENRSRIANTLSNCGRIDSGDFQMLGSNPVCQRNGSVPIRHQYNGAKIIPALACGFSTAKGFELALNSGNYVFGELRVGRHQDRLGASVMLSLGQQICSHPVGIVVRISHHEDF